MPHMQINADVNAPKALPHVLISNVPAKEGEYALKNEAWTQVLSEVPLDVPLDRFLPAVRLRFAAFLDADFVLVVPLI